MLRLYVASESSDVSATTASSSADCTFTFGTTAGSLPEGLDLLDILKYLNFFILLQSEHFHLKQP